MGRFWIALVFIFMSLLTQEQCAVGIRFDATAAEYIRTVIKEFTKDPTHNRYDSVIMPPRNGKKKEDFFLPKLFIWCPMSHYDLEILCPEHNIPLKATFFTDEVTKTCPRNPRLVYELRGNILLIQRMYVCNHNRIQHRYLSASLAVLETIPPLYGRALFPFIMFHQCACTKGVVDLVETQILQGVSFLRICQGIAALNFNEFQERVECSLMAQTLDIGSYEDTCDGFYNDIMYGFASYSKLIDIFLLDFKNKQPYYEEHMKRLAQSSESIMCDHTFKVTKYIAAKRGSDNKLIRQFENLFIILNEKRHIVGWRLTKTTAFEEIRDLLMDFSSTLNTNLKDVIVDDCCKVRAQYSSVFRDVNVKLDLFHAVQRVVKTIPKGTECSKQMSKEFGLVFRADGDCGEVRNCATPEPAIIEQHLDNFISTWGSVLEISSYSKTLRELENIKTHIRKGCLSGLKPGQGTECNEQLHSTINNSLLCGATSIGPELAVAVLSLIFYGINCKKSGKKHSSNARITPFMPVPANMHVAAKKDGNSSGIHFKVEEKETHLDNVWKCVTAQSNNLGSKVEIKEKLSGEIVVIEDIQDMCNEPVATLIIRNSCTLYDTLQNIDNRCENRSFNAYDIPIMQIFDIRSVLTNNTITNEERNQDDLLKRNLSSFNLCIESVQGDGDCAFKSIIVQLRKSKEWKDGKESLLEHLKQLGLGGSIENDVYHLRQLFVNSVQSSEIYQMFLGVAPEDVNFETERFRDEGTFCGEVGDLVIKVCSDILQVPILVVSNITGCPFVPFIPPEQVITSTLYIAYNANGPGHYDTTVPESELQGKVSPFMAKQAMIENMSVLNTCYYTLSIDISEVQP